MRDISSYEYDKKMNWDDRGFDLPFLYFGSSIDVRIIPPRGGATVRFLAKSKETGVCVSVYLDDFDNIRCVGEPYWEIFCTNGNNPTGEFVDCERFLFKDHENMMKRIKTILTTYANNKELRK